MACAGQRPYASKLAVFVSKLLRNCSFHDGVITLGVHVLFFDWIIKKGTSGLTMIDRHGGCVLLNQCNLTIE